MICLLWITRRAKKFDLPIATILDLSLIIMVFGFVGGRLMHVFYESFDYYQEDFLRIFYFWDGGFVFYGGALLAAVFGALFLQFKDSQNFEKYLDALAPVLSLSYAMGRIACLFAGCCYGRFCDLPWAVEGRHPTQAYASLWEFATLFVLLGFESVSAKHRRPHKFGRSGNIFFLWMVLHGVGRLIMEYFRDDFRGPTWGISISSWLSFLIIILGLYLLLRRSPTSGSITTSS
ncbi:MAG TPA: prolipoprotein diacylglyceryl transferase [Bdellovibrio sp.]|nr:prolipoprotein diacylglyceryl transferase [Bdellovibrio sp.]